MHDNETVFFWAHAHVSALDPALHGRAGFRGDEPVELAHARHLRAHHDHLLAGLGAFDSGTPLDRRVPHKRWWTIAALAASHARALGAHVPGRAREVPPRD